VITPVVFNFFGRRFDLQFDLDIYKYWPDMALVLCAQQKGAPEPEVLDAMHRLIKPGDTVVDGGANIGFFSVIMSHLVGPDGRVVAFEPFEQSHKKLMRNLQLNSCANVDVIQCPLLDELKHVSLYPHDDAGQISAWGEGEPVASVDSTTLDYDLATGPPVSFVKLDIEGAELAALIGARKLREGCWPVFVVEMNEEALPKAGASIQKVRDEMKDYQCFILQPNGTYPVWVPPHIPLKVSRKNTNVMFATWGQVDRAWPEAVAWA
jgi:FkbM family methyltransferase